MSILYIMKMALQGVNYLKNRGAGGVPFMDNTPGDMDDIGKECRLPLIYTLWLFGCWGGLIYQYDL